jgi:hypothetical protein
MVGSSFLGRPRGLLVGVVTIAHDLAAFNDTTLPPSVPLMIACSRWPQRSIAMRFSASRECLS